MKNRSLELKGSKFLSLGTTWMSLKVKQAILLTETTQLAAIKALIKRVRGSQF